MSDKVVKIEGKVSVDVNEAIQGVDKVQAGVDELNGGFGKLMQGMELILRSLASIAQKIDAVNSPAVTVQETVSEINDTIEETEDAVKQVDDAFQKVDDAVSDVDGGVKKVGTETDKVSKKTEAVKGIWQGVGQIITKGVVGGLNAVWDFVKNSFADGAEWNKLLAKMAKSTKRTTAEISADYVKMASDINASVLDFARFAEFNRTMGGTEESLGAVATAMQNYRYSGMEVNRQLEISAMLVKAFNMPLQEQENIIRRVAISSEAAGIAQDKYWNGLVGLAARMKDLGGTYKDIVALQEAAFQAGIKVEEEGAKGAVQLLENLKNPTDEMIQNFTRLGVVLTENSSKWNSVNTQLAAQKAAFSSLNEEINRYQRAAQAIGLLTREVSMQAEAYKKLEDKKNSGERLTTRERQAYREMARDLRSFNNELAQYDQLGGITNTRDLKKLSLYEKIQARLESATKAQEQYNLEADKMSFEAGPMAQQIQMLEAQLEPLMAKLRVEVPEAIRTMISDEGIGAVVNKLAAMPDSMAGMATEVQVLIQAVGNGMTQASTGVMQLADRADGLAVKFDDMVGKVTGGVAKITTWIENLKTLISGPLAQTLNSVGDVFFAYMQTYFGDSGILLGAVNGFADNLKTKIETDLDAVTRGDMTLMEVLRKWIQEAYNMLEPYLTSIGEKIGDAILGGMQKKLSTGIYNAFDVPGQWIQDKFYDMMNPGSYQGVATIDRNSAAVNSSTKTNNVKQNFVINGATDPQKTASEVSRLQKQAARNGFEIGGALG